ncbi:MULTISPECIES: substrate-binding periplasmic protein [Pseudomonas]|uniref:substrate-binding periplasmic protein n=1 Tax=Pseudomonas TaxID=286 RepID=UPI000540C87A|nr:ABC transporter substrate-binding protein [Pseudomonas parafulva]AIZ32273.1 amino acid ABC transporter substrate-binding protein [Pseudomonas parafulva]
MRRFLAILSVCSASALAEPSVMRFSIAESWSMPLIRLEDQVPVQGILFDLMQAVAREAEITPQYHVLARLRLEQAMLDGDIDVRCYVASDWLNERPGNFIWSVPLIRQRDLLVGRAGDTLPGGLAQLPAQAIGTVLGYTYPALQPLFAQHLLQREDSRNQDLALQKLQAGRYRYAVSNQLSLQWFNRQQPAEQRLRPLLLLEEQDLGCMVRNDPNIPAQRVLRAMVRLKQSGEVERIVQRYTQAAELQSADQ